MIEKLMITEIFSLIVLLLSIIIHEVAHGSIALSLGDPTAKDAGRLTLNPLKHLDFFGSIVLPLFLFLTTSGKGPLFGWTKPVPVNPYNFRDRKWGTFKVALAGPATNFLIALIFGLLIRFFNLSQNFLIFFSIISINNFAWGIFNLIPIPPLDGSHILFTLLPEKFSNVKFFLQRYSPYILIIFLLFGLNLVFIGAAFLYIIVTGQPII